MTATPPRPENLARANGMDLCWDGFGDEGAPPLLLIMGPGLADDRVARRLLRAWLRPAART